MLIAEFRLGHLLQGDFATRIWTHFLQTREVPWRGGAVIAPLLELANHSADGLQYERGMHLQVQGYVRQDIALRYGAEDAYSVFCRFGVLEPRPAAFSLSGRVQLEDKEIVIGRNTEKSVKRGKHRVPKTGIDGNTLTLSYLLLGHRQVPRLARGIFGTLLGEAGVTNPDEVFDYILRSNALKFIKLLKTLEPHEGEMVSMLRAMARHQLESMNHCIGNRPLGLASVPLE
ncbi:MAG TPA: hypothetical protein VHX61_05170 [Rhizomicrobium sp.]|nr:hypothetical protein [Rhizomicrobium sp.]